MLEIRTKDNDVKDQDNETEDSPSSAIMPRLSLSCDWCSSCQGEQRELEERDDGSVDHVGLMMMMCERRRKEEKLVPRNCISSCSTGSQTLVVTPQQRVAPMT